MLFRFIGTFRAHVGPVFRATWAPDSRLVITASEDSTIKLWKTKVRAREAEPAGAGWGRVERGRVERGRVERGPCDTGPCGTGAV